MSRLALLLVLSCALAVGLLPPPTPAQASGDYRQVVDLTFPLTDDTPVRYRDDYDQCRRRNTSGCVRHHQSTDLMVALGTPVHAVVGGRVRMHRQSRSGPPSWGWHLIIEGDDGREYWYLHLGTQHGPWDRAIADGVEEDGRVERGQLIGYAGCSGSAICGGGEHLHLEIHDSSVQDPYDHHDEERINPYPSLVAAERRGDHPDGHDGPFRDVRPDHRHVTDIVALAASGVTRGCGHDRFCPDAAVTRQQMASFLTRAMALPPADRHFSDVSSSNRHRRDIGALAARGITAGCGGDRFCPGAPVTRAQMASFIVRARGLPDARVGRFSDVPANHRHARDIAALAAAGVTRGCGSSSFCPDQPVTRAQMASFIVRAFGDEL